MSLRALLACLVLLPAWLMLTGCAALEPSHVTLTVGRDDAETTAGDKHARTRTTRTSVALTYDLPR